MKTKNKPAFVRPNGRGFVVMVPLDEHACITYYGDSMQQFTISPHPYRKRGGDIETEIRPDEFEAIKIVAENFNRAEKVVTRLSHLLKRQKR